MFCLRSWVPILFFLINASPVYIILFISATYFLNRPCFYCSVLLAILVLSLFDFQSSWFEPRSVSNVASECASNETSSTHTGLLETVSTLASALNNTVAAVAGAATEGIKEKVQFEEQWSGISSEWVKSLFRKEWKIPCVDVLVRL